MYHEINKVIKYPISYRNVQLYQVLQASLNRSSMKRSSLIKIQNIDDLLSFGVYDADIRKC